MSLFSPPARRASGLMPWSGRPSCVNIFSSETARPMKLKLDIHVLISEDTQICSWGSNPIFNMAAMAAILKMPGSAVIQSILQLLKQNLVCA